MLRTALRRLDGLMSLELARGGGAVSHFLAWRAFFANITEWGQGHPSVLSFKDTVHVDLLRDYDLICIRWPSLNRALVRIFVKPGLGRTLAGIRSPTCACNAPLPPCKEKSIMNLLTIAP